MIRFGLNLIIPQSEIGFSFARSSGPGGQNVNKTNSQAILRWNVYENKTLPWVVRQRILKKLASKISEEGNLIIRSDRFRDQKMNIEDCLRKFLELLEKAVIEPKKRIATKPSRASKERRLNKKKKHSEKKKSRKVEFAE